MAIDAKQVLLKLGEANAKALIKELLRPMAEEYINASPNKIDDILLPFMDHLEKALLVAADKIDGVEGN